MARSVALSSEEAFSFDAYLNVLNAPPEQRPPPSRRSSGEQPEAAGPGGQEGLGDNRADYLDDERKDHALQYLHQVRHRRGSGPQNAAAEANDLTRQPSRIGRTWS